MVFIKHCQNNECNKEFSAKRNEIKYCSRKCFDNDKNIKMICQNKDCNKEFGVLKHQSIKRKFCSIKCCGNSRKEFFKVNCCYKECNKEFLVLRSKYENRKRHFCSKICCDKGKVQLVETVCENKECNKTFFAIPSEIKRNGGKYCSKICSYRGLTKSKNVICLNKECNKEFSVTLNILKKGHGKCCSRACAGIYKSKREEDKLIVRRHSQYSKHYGLTFLEGETLKTLNCMICDKRTKRMMIDHHHETIKSFRGILCHLCNNGIGWVENCNIEVFSIVKDYLSKKTRTLDECFYFKEKWKHIHS